MLGPAFGFRMKTALITGVMGQDGTYLAELLAGKEYRVVGTSRAAEGVTAPSAVDLRTLDLGDAEAVARLVHELAPDEIYHLAGQSSVGRSFDEPVESCMDAVCRIDLARGRFLSVSGYGKDDDKGHSR